MNISSLPRRKYFELVILTVVATVFYFLYSNLDVIVLFSFGFIWNWANSVNLENILINRRYKFSLIRTVIWFQNLILKPFNKMPIIIKKAIKVLPAGLFWWLIIYINDSEMPYWATFLGSLFYELMQIEIKYIKSSKGIS